MVTWVAITTLVMLKVLSGEGRSLRIRTSLKAVGTAIKVRMRNAPTTATFSLIDIWRFQTSQRASAQTKPSMARLEASMVAQLANWKRVSNWLKGNKAVASLTRCGQACCAVMSHG